MAAPKLNLSRWQWTTLFTLTVGYAGYYFCRSNLSVATPLLIAEFGDVGIDKAAIGKIASIGVLFYAAGKLINGVLGDFIGGRQVFIFGMFASVVATVVFGFGTGATLFLVAWCFNRFVQSMGWGALVKTASRWFPTHLMGTILGILCLSYLFGDMAAKFFLGSLISAGIGWRGVFFASAAVLGSLFLFAFFVLKSSPEDVGEEEPTAHPNNLFGDEGNHHRPADLWVLLKPFFMSPSFWMICGMNFGLTIIRETFNFWTPTYLVESVKLTEGAAAQASSLFPFFGGLSVIATGMISDRFAEGRRGGVMAIFLVGACIALIGLALLPPGVNPYLPLVMISAIGFLMMGPYAFLSGVVAVDLGGKKGSATAAGLADTVGYVGAIVSGWGIASIAVRFGWSGAFSFLAAILLVTMAIAVFYWYSHEVKVATSESAGE